MRNLTLKPGQGYSVSVEADLSVYGAITPQLCHVQKDLVVEEWSYLTHVEISGSFTAPTKNSVVDHPLDAELLLRHTSLEGPEAALFFRGESELVNGAATVTLPKYFEALTHAKGRTVQLTPKFDSNEAISALAASVVSKGAFRVRALDKENQNQAFYWEVKAVRKDVAAQPAELRKSERKPAPMPKRKVPPPPEDRA